MYFGRLWCRRNVWIRSWLHADSMIAGLQVHNAIFRANQNTTKNKMTCLLVLQDLFSTSLILVLSSFYLLMKLAVYIVSFSYDIFVFI